MNQRPVLGFPRASLLVSLRESLRGHGLLRCLEPLFLGLFMDFFETEGVKTKGGTTAGFFSPLIMKPSVLPEVT